MDEKLEKMKKMDIKNLENGGKLAENWENGGKLKKIFKKGGKIGEN